MFGESGGLILQVGVTVLVILVLVGFVYWLVRRYSAGGLGRIGRGRVPRLALVDAMPVDGRRRLVLVRRDNVEHLILIGGPSDLVVEQSIQRVRRPVARSAAPPPPEGPPLEPPIEPAATDAGDNPPIPFPQARAQAGAPHQPAAHQPASQAGDRSFFPLRRGTAAQPARLEQVSTAPQFQETVEAEPFFPEMPNADPPSPAEEPAAPGPEPTEPYGNGRDQPRLDFGRETPAPANVTPFVPPSPAPPDTATKVSDLEREMARLLGEITGKRPA